MANDLHAVADFVADALDVARTSTSNLLEQSPLVARMSITDTADGSSTHKYNTYTGAPTGFWRAENAARDYDSSIDTVVTSTCKILDFSWKADKAVADTWRDGPEAYVAREGMRHLQAAMFDLEQQIIYGTTSPGDSAGFTGLLNSTDLDALADDMVVTATGSTASTQTSVYGLRLGDDHVKLVSPAGTLQLGDTNVQESTVDGSTGGYPVYYTPAAMFIAVQIGGKYSAGRIANLHASDSNANLDDDLLSTLWSQFPAGGKPDVWVMNSQSYRQLQQSRTATSPTGTEAPYPERAFGAEIIVTDALTTTEAVET
jgi:hypothetical protein